MKESEIMRKIVSRLINTAVGKADEIEMIRYAIDRYDAALFMEGYRAEEQAKKEGMTDGVQPE